MDRIENITQSNICLFSYCRKSTHTKNDFTEMELRESEHRQL